MWGLLRGSGEDDSLRVELPGRGTSLGGFPYRSWRQRIQRGRAQRLLARPQLAAGPCPAVACSSPESTRANEFRRVSFADLGVVEAEVHAQVRASTIWCLDEREGRPRRGRVVGPVLRFSRVGDRSHARRARRGGRHRRARSGIVTAETDTREISYTRPRRGGAGRGPNRRDGCQLLG